MHHGHRTLVSEAPRERRIWPWLVLLLLFAVGGSFAGVLWFVTHHVARPASSPSAAIASAPSPSASVTASANVAAPASVAIVTSSRLPAPIAHVPANASGSATTHSPPPSSPITGGPAPTPMATPGSGVKIDSVGAEWPDCNAEFQIAPMRNAVAACIPQFRFDPPVHESTGYVVWVETNGTIATVEHLNSAPAVPRLDACVADAFRKWNAGPQHQRCWFRAEYHAPCVWNWPGQCANASAAASAAASVMPSAMPIKR